MVLQMGIPNFYLYTCKPINQMGFNEIIQWGCPLQIITSIYDW